MIMVEVATVLAKEIIQSQLSGALPVYSRVVVELVDGCSGSLIELVLGRKGGSLLLVEETVGISKAMLLCEVALIGNGHASFKFIFQIEVKKVSGLVGRGGDKLTLAEVIKELISILVEGVAVVFGVRVVRGESLAVQALVLFLIGRFNIQISKLVRVAIGVPIIASHLNCKLLGLSKLGLERV